MIKTCHCNFNIHIKLSSSLFIHIFHYNVTILIPSLYLVFFLFPLCYIALNGYILKWKYISKKNSVIL